MRKTRIVVDGNIGCGKTTVIKEMNNTTRIPIFLEPLHKWNELLALFYDDPNKWAFPFNLEVMTTFNEWKDNSFAAVYERSPLSCRYVFTQLNHEHHHMHDLELKVFDKIYKELKWDPEVLIYIRTDPDICVQRMKERARCCESNVSLDYIRDVHRKYEDLVCNAELMAGICLHIVDGDQNKEKVFEDVKKIVEQYT